MTPYAAAQPNPPARAELHILWQRLVAGGDTCGRCADTGDAVRQAAEILRAELAPRGVAVTLEEKSLAPGLADLAESNRVFFNGRPLEALLGAAEGSSSCPSCRELLARAHAPDGPVCCRTLLLDGREHEVPPLDWLLRAGRAAAADL